MVTALANLAARFLISHITRVNPRWLAALKRELRGYEIRAGKWKPNNIFETE